jgi:hypothetical protein
MKSELDQITFYYLFLDSVHFTDEQLTISLSQAAVTTEKQNLQVAEQNQIKNLRSVEVMDNSLGYDICFHDAVYHQVIGESANDFSSDEIEHNGVIITFKKSTLLNYLKEKTYLFQVTAQDEKIVHYCVKTADDWIHVLAREEPKVVRRSST